LTRVASALADLALRRPWALLVGHLAVLTLAVALAVGAPDRLGIGSTTLSEDASGPDFLVATTGKEPVRSRVYRVSLDVISSQIRSDPAVVSVRRGKVSGDGRSTSLIVALEGDEGERQRSVQRIEGRIDPGPLRVAYGGEVATLLEARDELSGDLWKLELLVLPFALLVLAWTFGMRFAAAPALCAGTAIAGSLAAMRLVGAFADVSLLGAAPAAVVGLALGVEAPRSMLARFRDERLRVSTEGSLRRTLDAAWRGALPVGAAVIAATSGLLATQLDQAPSMVLGCAVAAVLALCSALVCVPALLVIQGGWGRFLPHTFAGWLAGSRALTPLLAVLAVAALLGAASPALEGESGPLVAQDLPADSGARRAADIAGRQAAATGDESLFDELPRAAAVSAAALALVLLASFRSLRLLPVAVVALLPAASAAGLCVFVFQDGHLAGPLGFEEQGTLETGALAAFLAALASISVARAVAILQAVRSRRDAGPVPEWGSLARLWVADAANVLVFAAAVAGTLIAGAASGVLAAADLYPAREFGFAVAAGLLLELVILRVPLLAAVARWG
jgi:uncharacterized membrane protein YdfJ with MMPL/SSD domain